MTRTVCLALSLAALLPAQTSVKVKVGAATLDLPLERYVAAVLAGEAGTFRSPEALKAMAVAARTYAVRLRGRHSAEGYDFCATTHCQHIDISNIVPRLEDAAAATAGELLWYAGKPAFACYTRDCGGRTEDGAVVWNLSEPYLKSHPDPYCPSAPWRWTADPRQILDALRQSQLRAPASLQRIDIVERTPSGRALTLALEGPSGTVRVSAGAFRFALGRAYGWNTLPSDSYQLHWPAFEGAGSGHGVGLCQRGADQMGVSGRTWREILAFYYPGTIPGLTGRGLSFQRLGGERITLLTTQPALDAPVLAAAERELAAASARLHTSPPSGIEIRVYPDLDTFRNATGEPGWLAARTSGRRVHLQPARLLESRGALTSTLRHEMFHIVMESQAAPGLPVWFREGLTEYLTGPASALSSSEADPAVRRAYREDAARVASLIRRYSEAAVFSWVSAGLPAELKDASKIQDPRNKK